MAVELPAGTVVLFGGRSEIGVSLVALTELVRGRTVVLAARRSDDLREERLAVEAAGATVHTLEFDAATGPEALIGVVDALEHRFGPIGTAILAFGILGDHERAVGDATHAAAVLDTDFVAQAVLLTELSARMRARRAGQLVVFSSIAGWRVRRANYVYGSAKAGLDGFVQGLTDALRGSGVRVLLVRPGFVIGRMTTGMDPAPLSSTPREVAVATAKALGARRAAVWVPGRLRWLALAARLTPRFIWSRLPR